MLPVDEWYISSTFNLDDDGRFRYYKTWSCYAGGTVGKAEGKWLLQIENVVVLETERIEEALRLESLEGQKFKALVRADGLDFGSDFIMSERPEFQPI